MTTYKTIVKDLVNDWSEEDAPEFPTYQAALAYAEQYENENFVHIHEFNDGEDVGCLWDNEQSTYDDEPENV